MDLSFSRYLKKIPNLSSATSLKGLILRDCSSLEKLPSTIGNTTSLEKLDLSYCTSLVELPSSIWNATNLQELYLKGCSGLVKLPSFIENAPNLRRLDLSRCSGLVKLPANIDCLTLVELPSSNWNATNLRELKLERCSSLMELPSSIGNVTSLEKLDLSDCSSLMKLPTSIEFSTSLEELILIGCLSLVKLPSWIGNATNLRELEINGCSSLMELPSSIGNATSLEKLDLRYCSSLVKLPSTIGNLHKLSDLDLEGCSKLEALPNNINLGSLSTLNLKKCSMYKTFPGISTNIKYLLLTNTELQELGPWIKGCSRLLILELNGMQKLVSISQLPDSLLSLVAENCMSLERLDCSFCNPEISLNFRDCPKLNQAARDLIIRTSAKLVVLPGVEVPDYFTNRASQSSVTVQLNQKKPLRTSTFLKACILVGNDGYCTSTSNTWKCCSTSKHFSGWFKGLRIMSSNHLYIFDSRVTEDEIITSTELDFNFKLDDFTTYNRHTWKILECGVLMEDIIT